MQGFLQKVSRQYQVVANPLVFRKLLLAWEFDPDVFVEILQRSLSLFKEAGLKYDLLHARPPGSPDKMIDQGFNLAPNAKGNDWPHISLGMFDRLKLEEIPSVVNMAKLYKPSFEMLRFGVLEAATTGLSYLVLDLWPNRANMVFERAIKTRHQDNFVTYADKGFPFRPHVSILGFDPNDTTKVLLIVQKLNALFKGKKIQPNAVQFWHNFHVVKHIGLQKAVRRI